MIRSKVVMINHSMGALVSLYFFKWVESPRGGNGGRLFSLFFRLAFALLNLCVMVSTAKWIEDHVDSLVNIGGPLLGVPKSISALLSGSNSRGVLRCVRAI